MASLGPPPDRRPTVLDDKPQLLDLIEQILLAQGYEVLAMREAPAALALALRHPGPIDLVITDVTMNPMSGPELVVRLLASRPTLKVLYRLEPIGDGPARAGYPHATRWAPRVQRRKRDAPSVGLRWPA